MAGPSAQPIPLLSLASASRKTPADIQSPGCPPLREKFRPRALAAPEGDSPHETTAQLHTPPLRSRLCADATSSTRPATKNKTAPAHSATTNVPGTTDAKSRNSPDRTPRPPCDTSAVHARRSQTPAP